MAVKVASTTNKGLTDLPAEQALTETRHFARISIRNLFIGIPSELESALFQTTYI